MSSNPMKNSQQPIDALAGKLQRTELQHSASSIPGREIVQVLIEIPAGVELRTKKKSCNLCWSRLFLFSRITHRSQQERLLRMIIKTMTG